MYQYEPSFKKLIDLMSDIYDYPGDSMDTYEELVTLCGDIVDSANASYISEKITDIKIEAEMIASGEYEPGFNCQLIRQNIRGYIDSMDGFIKDRRTRVFGNS